MELRLATRTAGASTIVEVGGEIDIFTTPQLREHLDDLVRQGNNQLVVDLSQVEFLDSTGLGALAYRNRYLTERGGSMRLVCTQDRILKIFRIIGLESAFGIYPSVAEALEATESGS